MAKQNLNTSTTALKALRVLEAVAYASTSVSASDVAAIVDMDKAAVYRMLVTLVNAGYVLRDENSKRYRLGYKVVSLSRNLLADNKISRLVRHTLEEISTETGETVHYSVLDGDETVLVQKVKGNQLIAVDFQIGDRARMHCTAIGKVMLAYQNDRFIESIIDAGLPKFASKTFTHPDELKKELSKIRTQGYALDDHELSDDMRCIAVPVFEGSGSVRSGISISGPDSRFDMTKLHELKIPMMESAKKLSEQIGGSPWSN